MLTLINMPLLRRRSLAEIRKEFTRRGGQSTIRNSLIGLSIVLALASPRLAWGQDSPTPAKDQPRVYVPYKDLGAVVDSVGKAVLMDRAEFAKLLAAADANASAADSLELGAVSQAQYVAVVAGQTLQVSGTLKLTSLSDRPVAVPLEFAQIGLTQLALDGKPAPLGYDRQGKLTVIVTGKGEHTLTVAGAASLTDLASGGVQFTINLPAAAASTMALTAPGDLEIHANVPVSTPVYSKATDRTAATITFGGPIGQNQLAVTLQGNGRAEDQRAIILGQSNTAITLNHAGQSMDCQFNVHVLRRGVRELTFELDEAWTITDVQCPNMVKWSIRSEQVKRAPGVPYPQTLVVSLKSASRGSQVVRISAWAPFKGLEWTSPTVRLVGADYQRGLLLVDAGEELKFRGESFTDARRENVSPALQASAASGPLGVIAATSRLYSHWGEKWQVKLDLAALEGRSTSDERQVFVISDKDITVSGNFTVTALAKDLYSIAIEIPRGSDPKEMDNVKQSPFHFFGWNLESVLVNGRKEAFEYKVEQTPMARLLRIELASPVRPDTVAQVSILLRHIPNGWDSLWSANQTTRPSATTAPSQASSGLELPLMRCRANMVNGIASVQTVGDLESQNVSASAGLKEVSVGRMASVGLPSDTQSAWSYTGAGEADGQLASVRLSVTKRTPRLIAQSVGLVSVMPGKLIGDYRVTYRISRASTTMLYLLVDKSIGSGFTVDGLGQAVPMTDENAAPNMPPNLNASDNQSAQEQGGRLRAVGLKIVSKSIVEPSSATAPVGEAVAAKYNLWQLVFDGPTSGIVHLMVRYETAISQTDSKDGFDVPMVRPIGAGQYNEVLAIQAAQELAVTQKSTGTSEIDAIELPVLPAPYKRLLWAFRLDSQQGMVQGTQGATQSANAVQTKGDVSAVRLTTTAFDNYAIPVALATSAIYTTYVGPEGSQRTSATFSMLNSGLQFLAINLPADARLWSIRIGHDQAKPKKGLANQYLVSLPRMSSETPVEVVYACNSPAKSLEKLSLGAVALEGVPVNEVMWNVVPPPGYQVTGQQSHMQADRVYRARPAYETVLDEINPLGRYCASGGSAKSMHQQVPPTPEASVSDEGSLSAGGQTLGALSVHFGGVTTRPSTQPARTEFDAWRGDSRMGSIIDRSGSMTTVMAAGRYTLPIELVATPDGGQAANFSCLGQPTLAVTMASEQNEKGWWLFEFGLFFVIGIALLRRRAWTKFGFIVGTFVISSLVAIWSPSMTAAANGAFHGVLALIPLYIAVGFARGIVRMFKRLRQRPDGGGMAFKHSAPRGDGGEPGDSANMPVQIPGSGSNPGVAPGSTTAGVIIALMAAVAIFGGVAMAAEAPAGSNLPAAAPSGPLVMSELPLVFPYDDPATLSGEKVLVPYGQFVAAWNAAHPDKPLDIPSPIAGVALADVKYAVAISGDQDSAKAQVVLTATVVSPGKLSGQINLPMALSRMAVVEATFNGKAASLKVGPNGMVLPLSAADLDSTGRGQLRVVALARPQVTGDSSQRGSLQLGLPALPAAVMAVSDLDDESLLEAELDGKPAPWRPEQQSRFPNALVEAKDHHSANVWSLPLGNARDVVLRWSPKSAPGAADKTLSAVASHEVYFFNWGVLGQTTIDYTFSAGQYDHFAVLLPAGVELREVSGPNIRDHNVAAEVTQDGQTFKVVDVRLHRPAAKSYRLAIQWITKLPALDKPQALVLPQASQVGRESGTVSLYASGGVNLKVADVSGGRRASDSPYASADTLSHLAAEEAAPVAKYYWPYRPFAMSVQLSRPADSGSVKLSQLVRINQDQPQVFAQAALKARQGLVYGASFALPDGYELLSAVGSDVADWYIQTVPTGRLLHVSLRGGVSSTNIAIALVREGLSGQLERFDVPVLRAVDPQGKALAEQTGLLAVQVAKSLDAQTAASENLKAVVPSATAGWLGAQQAGAVQFAYSYEKPDISLSLAIKPLPTKKRVEMLAAVNIQPTWAQYVYRMRYTIEGSPVDRVSFVMPSKYASLAQVKSPALRSATQADAGKGMTRWTVTLTSQVTGMLDVTVNFVLPVESELTTISMPPVRPESPDEYKAIVAVGNFSNRQLTLKDSAVLSPLSWQQQQEAVGAEMAKTLQYVWQAISDDWSLTLELSPAKASAKVPAVVDLLDVTTVIDSQGNSRYEAKISLQNRSEQFLKLRLPPGLDLWSAIVADEPVKPVVPAGAPAGAVLIPLIKTSAGGLPYDIKLYLGGKASGPLSGVTKLQPPAIAIEDMPVVRTTWSLRLPAGYRYFTELAGGNASPIAGTAEKMAIEVDAMLDQAKRYDESSAGLVTAGDNQALVVRNRSKLSGDIAAKNRQAQEYIDNNRDKLSKDDYGKLNTKLGVQREASEALSDQWKQREQEANRQGPNFNDFVNGTAINPGTDDRRENKALEDAPTFFDEANKRNLEAVDKDIKKLDELKKVQEENGRLSTQGGKVKMPGKPGDHLEQSLGNVKGADKLIADDGADNSEYYLDGKDANKQIAEQTQQLMQKKEQLTNNAVNRKLSQSGEQGQQFGQMGGGGGGGGRAVSRQPNESTPQPGTVPGPTARPNTQGLISGESADGDKTVSIYGVSSNGAAGSSDFGPQSSRGGAGSGAGEAGWDNRPRGERAGYTGASYSMPISLPAGQVQLDFAHPSGQAVVAVWAVPQRMIDSTEAAAALILAIIVLVVARGIWRGRRWGGRLAKGDMPMLRKFIAAAMLVVCAILLLFGSLGSMIAVVVIVAIAIAVRTALADILFRSSCAGMR